MMETTFDLLSEIVRHAVIPLRNNAPNLDSLLTAIGNAPYVLIGESSHGTHEFYRIRAEITKRLICEKGFRTIAIEGDWPDTARVNRFIHGAEADANAREALDGFQRFPSWMWRNADVLDFVGWLRHFNESQPEIHQKAGIYGLDLYSLHASMAAVIAYLETVDPEQAGRARQRYACFDTFGSDVQAYGYAAGLGLSHTCEAEVIAQLMDLHGHASRRLRNAPDLPVGDEVFSAEQNALIVRNAEEYYRTMFFGRSSSWNLRDSHMAATFDRLLEHLQETYRAPKIVIWAHNSHIGDARATQMGRAGEHNIGQLLRTRYGAGCFNIGFTTYEGTVTAADAWDGSARLMKVQPARPESYEDLFHRVGLPTFVVPLKRNPLLQDALQGPLLERAIGVIYRPDSELKSHYFSANLALQFDAVVHVDRTRGVEPLEKEAAAHPGEPDETFPSGF